MYSEKIDLLETLLKRGVGTSAEFFPQLTLFKILFCFSFFNAVRVVASIVLTTTLERQVSSAITPESDIATHSLGSVMKTTITLEAKQTK